MTFSLHTNTFRTRSENVKAPGGDQTDYSAVECYRHSLCVILLSPALQVTDPGGFMAAWVMKSSPKTALMTL